MLDLFQLVQTLCTGVYSKNHKDSKIRPCFHCSSKKSTGGSHCNVETNRVQVRPGE